MKGSGDTFAERLRDARPRSMSQQQAGESLGVSRRTISRWESGRDEPKASQLLALAELYQVSPCDLLLGADN